MASPSEALCPRLCHKEDRKAFLEAGQRTGALGEHPQPQQLGVPRAAFPRTVLPHRDQASPVQVPRANQNLRVGPKPRPLSECPQVMPCSTAAETRLVLTHTQ